MCVRLCHLRIWWNHRSWIYAQYSLLWQRHHQSHICTTNSIKALYVVNEATHLMKVSEISCLEVTHRINFCKVRHGYPFQSMYRDIVDTDCTEVSHVDTCKINYFISFLIPWGSTLPLHMQPWSTDTNRSVDACQIIEQCICYILLWLAPNWWYASYTQSTCAALLLWNVLI